jgi:sRNA-binding protein
MYFYRPGAFKAMSNSSLKEQLEQVASQLSGTFEKKQKMPEKRRNPVEKLNKNKPKWLDHAQYGVELLKAYFPEAFKSSNEIKPLKKGIKLDLVKRLSTISTIVTEDKACMIKSLAYYVNTLAYHRSVQTGVARIDLDGVSDGVVSSEEAQYSLDRHQAKQQARIVKSKNKMEEKIT